MPARRIAVVYSESTDAKGVDMPTASILVNSMSPGWVQTDMGGGRPHGQFLRDRKPIPW